MSHRFKTEVFPQRYGLLRVAVWVGRFGVTEMFRLKAPVHHPWEELEEVVTTPFGVVLRMKRGQVWIGRSVTGWQRIAKLAEGVVARRRSAAEEPPEPQAELVPLPELPPVSAEEIREWLGIGPGEMAVADGAAVRPAPYCRPLFRALLAGIGCFSALFLLGVVWPHVAIPVIPLVALLGMCLGLAWETREWAKIVRPKVLADEHGLSVREHGRWRFHPWGDLRDVERWYDPASASTDDIRDGWQVTAADGEFVLHRDVPNAERIAEAARQAVEAQRRGRLLPQTTAVPAAAVSLVNPDEQAADRGLSRGA